MVRPVLYHSDSGGSCGSGARRILRRRVYAGPAGPLENCPCRIGRCRAQYGGWLVPVPSPGDQSDPRAIGATHFSRAAVKLGC